MFDDHIVVESQVKLQGLAVENEKMGLRARLIIKQRKILKICEEIKKNQVFGAPERVLKCSTSMDKNVIISHRYGIYNVFN